MPSRGCMIEPLLLDIIHRNKFALVIDLGVKYSHEMPVCWELSDAPLKEYKD